MDRSNVRQSTPASPPELLCMRLVAFCMTHGLARKAQEELSQWLELKVPSVYCVEKELEARSKLTKQVYHCCINSCILFAGDYKNHNSCRICSELRLDNRKKPRNVFRYLPIIPRIQAFFKSPRMIQKLQYRQELGPFEGTSHDVFGSDHFCTLLDTRVKVDNVTYQHKVGEIDTDIFLGLAFDGVSLYHSLGARQSKSSTTCWPIAVVVYSLDPSTRTRKGTVRG